MTVNYTRDVGYQKLGFLSWNILMLTDSLKDAGKCRVTFVDRTGKFLNHRNPFCLFSFILVLVGLGRPSFGRVLLFFGNALHMTFVIFATKTKTKKMLLISKFWKLFRPTYKKSFEQSMHDKWPDFRHWWVWCFSTLFFLREAPQPLQIKKTMTWRNCKPSNLNTPVWKENHVGDWRIVSSVENRTHTPTACRLLKKAYFAEQIQRCHIILLIPSSSAK